MLKSFSSSARVCVNPSTPVFDAEYAVNLGYGEGAPAPEILIILPLRCLFMCGIILTEQEYPEQINFNCIPPHTFLIFLNGTYRSEHACVVNKHIDSTKRINNPVYEPIHV